MQKGTICGKEWYNTHDNAHEPEACLNDSGCYCTQIDNEVYAKLQDVQNKCQYGDYIGNHGNAKFLNPFHLYISLRVDHLS